MPIPVTPDAEAPAAYYCDETAGPTTTITRKTVPGGAACLEIGLFQTTGTVTTAKFLFVVFNAIGDAEETTMLANPSTRLCIPTGKFERLLFSVDDPLLRYAFASDAAAETAGSKCIQRIGSLL